MDSTNFYCQKACGEIDFSIDEWNETAEALELTNLSEEEKDEILFPEPCDKQCFDCMAVVGARRLKTQKMLCAN
tara:strand:- start:481 stop:702 length:222 start_codon:yes stop_codon:yes gene_type:complete